MVRDFLQDVLHIHYQFTCFLGDLIKKALWESGTVLTRDGNTKLINTLLTSPLIFGGGSHSSPITVQEYHCSALNKNRQESINPGFNKQPNWKTLVDIPFVSRVTCLESDLNEWDRVGHY